MIGTMEDQATNDETAKLSKLKQGDFVQVDAGFTCISPDETRQVKYCPSGLFIDCDHGYHFLSGQLDNDGDSLIGIFPVSK